MNEKKKEETSKRKTILIFFKSFVIAKKGVTKRN